MDRCRLGLAWHGVASGAGMFPCHNPFINSKNICATHLTLLFNPFTVASVAIVLLNITELRMDEDLELDEVEVGYLDDVDCERLIKFDGAK